MFGRNEANRALKFTKDNSDVTLQYHIRGYITLLVNVACFDGNKLPYMVLALYDSYQREQLGSNTGRRTGLDIMVMKERSHQLKISWDPSFTAAKRKSKAERQQNMQEGAIPKKTTRAGRCEFMDYFLLLFGWCVVRNALSCSCSGRNHTAVTDAVVQTDPMPMDPVITTLEMNLEEANSSNEHLLGQNFRMQMLLREL
ncbi:unnamed protein product, partial [Effrenium voratum]